MPGWNRLPGHAPGWRNASGSRRSWRTTPTAWRWASTPPGPTGAGSRSSSRSAPPSAPASSSTAGSTAARPAPPATSPTSGSTPAADIPCSCGNTGCLETVASGAALVRILRERGADVSSTEDVVRLAADADPLATRTVRRAGDYLGQVLAANVNFFNPEAVYLGGMLSTLEPFVAAVRSQLYEGCHPLDHRAPRPSSGPAWAPTPGWSAPGSSPCSAPWSTPCTRRAAPAGPAHPRPVTPDAPPLRGAMSQSRTAPRPVIAIAGLGIESSTFSPPAPGRRLPPLTRRRGAGPLPLPRPGCGTARGSRLARRPRRQVAAGRHRHRRRLDRADRRADRTARRPAPPGRPLVRHPRRDDRGGHRRRRGGPAGTHPRHRRPGRRRSPPRWTCTATSPANSSTAAT